LKDGSVSIQGWLESQLTVKLIKILLMHTWRGTRIGSRAKKIRRIRVKYLVGASTVGAVAGEHRVNHTYNKVHGLIMGRREASFRFDGAQQRHDENVPQQYYTVATKDAVESRDLEA
jgi:hypothetical protein